MTSSLRASRRPFLLLCLSLAALLGAASPAAAAETQTEAERLVAIAQSQVGDNYAFAAIGPDRFDCSGLVWFAFREAGLRDRIGDKRKSVDRLYRYFNSRGKADRENPQVGDLVVWGHNKHIGIYIGDGMAVSALVNPYGVRIHPVKGYLQRPLQGIPARLHGALGQLRTPTPALCPRRMWRATATSQVAFDTFPPCVAPDTCSR